MVSRFLLPHNFRLIGLIVLVPFIVLGVLCLHMDFEFAWFELKLRPEGNLFDNPEYENFTNELAMIGVLVGLMFIAFSREKFEDEYIGSLRLDSLLIAVIINYALVLLGILFVYGFGFFMFLIYNMYTVLVLFILRFEWVKYRSRKTMES